MAPKFVLTLALFCLCATFATAQIVVEHKPSPPTMEKQLKAPKDDTFFLVPAEWAVKDGSYYFVQPRYVKERPGMKYVPGKWKKVKGGWTWKLSEWKAK